MNTGYITLKRGTYHITASSLVTYNDLKVDPSAPGWNTHERPNGGYARLRDASLPSTTSGHPAISTACCSSCTIATDRGLHTMAEFSSP